jgi:hypothetical protein
MPSFKRALLLTVALFVFALVAGPARAASRTLPGLHADG